MRIRFGRFELDDERYVLTRGGEPAPLRPKVFDLLVTLVRERRRVVLREELFASLWSTTAVGPGSLAGLVNELRCALGEDGRGPSSIRTVHARGYQFVADVEVLGAASAASTAVTQPVEATEGAAPPDSPDDGIAASGASRLERAFVAVQLSGPRALVALMPDRRRRATWLAAAEARAQTIGFEARRLVVPTSAEPGAGDLSLDPGSGSARAARGAGDASGGRDPIVLCLDVEAVADWWRAGGLRRCLDLMGRAPVLVLAALAANPDERTIAALVEGDPRIDFVPCEAKGRIPAMDAMGAERSPEMVEMLQSLASADRAAFERALRAMGFESQNAGPVRSLRRVEPGPSRMGRAREREVG